MDYITLTKQYLQRYPWLKYYVQHLSEQVRDTYETAVPMVAQYGEHIGHSSVERMHPGAKLAENRSFNIVKQDLRNAQDELSWLEGALCLLSADERKLIELRYFAPNQASWLQVAMELHCGDRQPYRIHGRALYKLSIALFGKRAV